MESWPSPLLEDYRKLQREHRLMPVRVNAFYRRKLEEEQIHFGPVGGPLCRAMLPTREKIDLVTGQESDDFIDDHHQVPDNAPPNLLHKYPDRVLYMPTHHCLSNCLYCFRQEMLEENRPNPARHDEELVAYLTKHPEVKELILSGGDPLLVPLQRLQSLWEKVLRHTGVRRFRVHTRAPIFDPASLSEGHRALFAELKVRVVLHTIHPYELCDDVRALLEGSRRSGVRLYNQFPLLRGVNDHVEVISRLLEDLDDLQVRNLSIFFPEPVRQSAIYRIPFARVQSLVRELQQTSPSWLHGTRFSQDTSIGKVQLSDLVSCDGGVARFRRGNAYANVPDFPSELDEPGDLKRMLWKEA